MSPSDRWTEVVGKVEQWLAAGCRSCWVVDPATRTVQVFAHDGGVRRYHAADVLADEAVLPGFSLQIAGVFDAEA